MAIDIGAWLSTGGGGPAGQAATRAALAWRRIQDKPSSLAFRTPAGVTLAAQSVRVENDSNASPTTSTAGKSAARRVVVFGVRDHATEADTDVAVGYRFVLNSEEFRVEDIILTLGEVQALCQAVG